MLHQRGQTLIKYRVAQRHMGLPLRQDQRVDDHGARAYREHQKQGSTTARCRWSELDGWFTQPNDVKRANDMSTLQPRYSLFFSARDV